MADGQIRSSTPTSGPAGWRLSDQRALAWAIDHFSSAAVAIQTRNPLTDRYSRQVYDVDLMVFAVVPTFLPERRHSADPGVSALDIVWYPSALLDQPDKLAQLGLAAHRFLASVTVFDPAGASARCRQAVEACFRRPDIQANRLNVFFDTGYRTIREIGITWDFPELALFWLHMAYSSCIAVAIDGLGGFCPNVFTRPFPYLDQIEQETGWNLRAGYVETLALHSPPLDAVEPLRRIHRVVAARFCAPVWPEAMRKVTRAEYQYTLSEAELNWRIAVAVEMAEEGFPEAALYYLRFWAYCLARIPMIYYRAQEGSDAAFLQPECAVRPDLERHCPEILDDLRSVFCGGFPISFSHINKGIASLIGFRDAIVSELRQRGVAIGALPEWRPHRSAPESLATA